jgi:hypothetical protein
MDIHCVTRWSKFDTVWEGVSVKTMVENGLIQIKPTATHVMQHAEYGFTVNLPLEVFCRTISSYNLHERRSSARIMVTPCEGRFHPGARTSNALFMEGAKGWRFGIHAADRRGLGQAVTYNC